MDLAEQLRVLYNLATAGRPADYRPLLTAAERIEHLEAQLDSYRHTVLDLHAAAQRDAERA